MSFHEIAGAACRTLTARKDGPSLHDICDPLLLNYAGGDRHLGKFYRTALGNPAMRPLLRRAGLPELRDESRLHALRRALLAARDDPAPDWAAIGRPVAALLDTIDLRHPQPPSMPSGGRWPNPGEPGLAEIEAVIRTCGAHLLKSYRANGFIPTYAAFNLIGDPDVGGRELEMALTGLNARGYKNSTLLFNLARVFIARSPAAQLINPPWRGIAEPMWQPMQIRHRSAYYDAFFTEALLSFVETGLASPGQMTAARRAIDDMVEFCLVTSREDVRSADGKGFSVITALAPLPHPRFSRFFSQIKQDLGFGIYVPDCDTTACAFSAATQAGSTDPILDQPLLDFYAGYQVDGGTNEPRVTVPLNDNIDYEGGVVTWIDNLAGERPYRQRSRSDPQPRHPRSQLPQSGALEGRSRRRSGWRRCAGSSASRNGWRTAAPSPIRARTSIICRSCTAPISAAAMRRSWRCPPPRATAIDPGGAFEFIRRKVLSYVENDLIGAEMNVFDAALALIALGHLGGERASFTPALHCIVSHLGEGGRHGPFKAYEWNKMKTPIRILVGGPEVTSAFVLMGLALARRALT